jgi:hypothetical protein
LLLPEFKDAVPGLADKGHPEKIRLFGWFLHTQDNRAHFHAADVKSCYDKLHLPLPSSFSGYFTNLVKQKDFIQSTAGYRLSAAAREPFDKAYGNVGHTVQITGLLLSLPAQIPNLAERTYLEEAYICYKHAAFRAAIVMTWNLAYHHLCDFILKQKLAAFNARWPISNPGHHKKAGISTVTTMDDFGEEFKESQVITIARDAGIITGDVYKILDEKLGKRNSAAHPSSVNIGQLQADAFIDDLVKNVVLKIV